MDQLRSRSIFTGVHAYGLENNFCVLFTSGPWHKQNVFDDHFLVSIL